MEDAMISENVGNLFFNIYAQKKNDWTDTGKY